MIPPDQTHCQTKDVTQSNKTALCQNETNLSLNN